MGSTERCDLAIGIMLLASGSGLSSYGGWRLVCRHGRRFTGIVAVVVFIATLGFAARCHGQLDLAHLLPVSGAIVLGNWIPIGSAALTGIVAGQSSIPAWRRLTIIGMLTGLAWYTVVRDVLTPASWAAAPRFLNGVCMQTTADSCSASCAASLLMEHGISARESEMMALCLTRHGGTPELGLYRGLKLKTQDTSWDVQVLSCTSEAFLRPDAYPALLLVDADVPVWMLPLGGVPAKQSMPSSSTESPNTGRLRSEIPPRAAKRGVSSSFASSGSVTACG